MQGGGEEGNAFDEKIFATRNKAVEEKANREKDARKDKVERRKTKGVVLHYSELLSIWTLESQ